MISSIGESSESYEMPTAYSPLWTVEGCLHAGKMELVRFLASQPEFSFSSLVKMPKQELAPDALESWRADHHQVVAERRKAGVIQGMKRRAQTLALQRLALQEISELQAGWLEESGGDPRIVAALTVAHWTVWASRRAKWHRQERTESDYGDTYQVRGTGRPTRRFPVRNWKQERRWYGYKDEALGLLYRTGWLQVKFYQPKLLWIDELCEAHYDDWCEAREFLHTSFGEFVGQHEKELSRCETCRRDPLHYALYSLELRPPFLHHTSYRFHVPYGVGKAYLPEPGLLAHVFEMEESEGLFRFGRPLVNEEVAKYSAPFVERHIARALRELQALLDPLEANEISSTVAAIPARE